MPVFAFGGSRIAGGVAVVSAVMLVFLVFSTQAFGQAESATVFGRMTDPSGAVIASAEIEIRNVDTGLSITSTSNDDGLYSIPSLQPGNYVLSIRKTGFRTVSVTNLELNVQDQVARNFVLQIGSTSESITVTSEERNINTTDGAVGTVVDRKFVQNMPLNGRSFQTLIALTPGVVLTPSTSGEQGQFSVNGQRADSNYFTVDGVSANVSAGTAGTLGQSAAGAIPAFSATGTTSSLVSVDAMQEFRVQTSSFAPEFGRTPGGQIAIVTRSGTNDLHGTVSEYLRNDALDANNWFADHDNLPKPGEKQNDFGGVLGGAIVKNKTFFFLSYEGLRLLLPQTQQDLVPDLASRQSAPPQIQPYLNAFPVPNGPEAGDNLAQLNASYSDPSSLDAYSVRVDENVNAKLNVFARYSYSPSSSNQRGPQDDSATVQRTQLRSHTFTVGATMAISSRVNNEVRANYSNVASRGDFIGDTFGGAKIPSDALLFPAGFSTGNSFFFYEIIGAGSFEIGKNAANEQRQVNIVDNLSFAVKSHRLKVGVDYRWLNPFVSPLSYEDGAAFLGMNGVDGALSGTTFFGQTISQSSVSLLSRNLSLYGQDTWRASRRLSLTYGLRWDLNLPLSGKNNENQPFAVNNLNDPANLSLATRGVPLYATSYTNVAPRIGLAYQLNDNQDWLTVFRAGGGAFYDLGSGTLGSLTAGFPYSADNFFFGAPFPFSPQQSAPPVLSTNPPAPLMVVADRNLKTPKTYQWNAAIEQGLGGKQSFSVTYIGSAGRDLLREDVLTDPNPNFGTVFVTRNTATSNYNALQLQFQRRLSHRVQSLASYTWSHSIDTASNDSSEFNVPSSVANSSVDRGDSDFDVRHSMTAALSYDLPGVTGNRFARALTDGWSLDGLMIARTGVPINLTGATVVIGNAEFSQRPDVVPGESFYLHGAQFPGDLALNRAAFIKAPTTRQGDLGRNALRGFGAWQFDMAARREIKLSERLHLQFRAEFFNLVNHPNFGNPVGTLSSQNFGLSTQILASALGAPAGGSSAGLSPLYQVGGPRSVQFALKLQF